MASIKQIHALLLEESLLHLLRNSGYSTVEEVGNDETLSLGKSGLEVRGRGENHQIDAISDYKATPPFCNPVRLLVEGKFENKKTGISIIRNAVGVLKDLQEHFTPGEDYKDPSKSRFHYTYAIFSASAYTKGAQRYAYAQDIYLLPIARSKFFEPIFDSIKKIHLDDFGNLSNGKTIKIKLNELRKQVRISLKDSFQIDLAEDNEVLKTKFKKYIHECKKIDLAFLGIAGKSFPILLIKNPNVSIDQIQVSGEIKIYWDQNSWYIDKNGQTLFSFDLPEELFRLYAKNKLLTKERALDLKQSHLFQFKIFIESENELKYLILKLDSNWINQIRKRYSDERDNLNFRFRENNDLNDDENDQQ